MKKPLLGQHDYLDAFIKTAQYLAGLTTQQDMWGETGKVLVNFFGADLCVFGERRADGEIQGHHWTFSDQVSNRRNLGTETKEAIAEVLESSFLTSQLIFTPDLLSAAFLPITQKSQVTDVMLVGHKISGPIPKELLNVYLAMARLIGTTAEGLASEIELRKHRDHLDELVKDRTIELTKTNAQLQQEIIERKQVEGKLRGSEAGLQMVNEELERLSNIDGLTGLYNRRFFDAALDREWKRHQRNRFPFSLILCDIDYFKKFNDSYGHQAGDECLQDIAEAITMGSGRSSDVAARYGGEEFVVILPETGTQGALKAAETIRRKIRALKIPHKNAVGRGVVSVSFGVATMIPEKDVEPSILVNLADKALYASKEAGRDRVTAWPMEGVGGDN
ncbi:MAG: diguanylate cyclase [Deltaproteobacteria bacterium]|nr:diguanylate cyclase [Deltaproteobacteria bacterium]